ncbi:uncharacterized protein LOC108674661 [Hyalella azteca]|uniref:Carbohydrate sulfotransferase n=1 Tax=Hyalella azteca TaxID=294128 RepID=A0A8B7NZ09_HYAAZ|nr:uncharacterized protein LOC108674661 [Hyalella azteca]
MIDSWIRVSKPHELAYCQLEKTGSSTLLTFLFEINNMETLYPRNDDLHQTSLNTFKVVGQEAVDMAEKFFDIVQVRHPFTRLVSCYCDKILGERPPFLKKFTEFRSHRNQTAEDMVREQLPSYRFLSDANKGTKTDQWKFQLFLKIIPAPGKEEYLARESRIKDPEPLGETPTFRDFVMEAAYQILRCGDNQDCRKEVNASYGRQIDKCDPCSWNFDLLMKLETIDEDFPLLRKLLGHNKPKAVDESGSSSSNEERVVHRKISACRSYDEYMRQLSSGELDLIYTAYYEDFEVFGYEPFNVDIN